MMSTRTSARLASMKRQRITEGTGKICEDEEHSDTSESETEDRPAPRKRQRVITKPRNGVARRSHVQDRREHLAALVTMPIEIFTKIASHLLPADIISLARSNKFLRNLLMRRPAIHIWHGAMKNIAYLPPCPPNLSEPYYLALMFSKTCSNCGGTARGKMDPFLLVRFCGPCRDAHLMTLDAVPVELKPWVLFSGRRRSPGAHVLREEVTDLRAQYDGRKQSNDSGALKAWTDARKEAIQSRQQQAMVLTRFLNGLEYDREQDLMDMKAGRQLGIKRRLMAMGWTEEDMVFGWRSTHEKTWSKLLSQPKPLTDRVWANLEPKLIFLLEANRGERMAAKREARKRRRQECLSRLVLDIHKQKKSLLVLEVNNPVARFSGKCPTIRLAHYDPFPSFAHTLEWPLVNDLLENDSSVEAMRASFEEQREEITTLIDEWKGRFQSHFVHLVHDGYETTGESLRPTIAVCNEGLDSLAHVSDDLKLLLRADSFFYNAESSDSSKPLSYGTILSTEGLTGSPYGYGSTDLETALNPDYIGWYSEAHEVARELLADMGRPDASYLEMMSVGAVFMCGRCHETEHWNWEEMVHHYIKQRQVYAEILEDEARLLEEGITFHNVHDSAQLTNRPMLTDCATKTLETIAGGGGLYLHECKVCQKIPVIEAVLARESIILQHLLDVHGVTEPKLDEHYALQIVIFSGVNGDIPWYPYDDDCDKHMDGSHDESGHPSGDEM